ncbi:MAG: DUF1501 domain-containing protein, partial [Planctomycetota bacterium]
MSKNRFTRRRFLKGAACGAGAVSILPIIGTRSARAVQGIPGRFMVVINMLGGNDGLNTVVPAHLTPYVSRRPTINLVDANNRPAGTSLLDLDGNFKLHYNMPAIKQIWDQNDLHIVQKVSYPSPNQSHFTSQDIMSFGVRDSTDNDGRGWLGRFADEYCSNPNEPLGVVSVGMGRRRDFESDVTTPLILSSVSGFNIDSDNDYRTDHVLRERVVRSTLATDPIPGAEPAFSIFDANRQAYDLIDQVQSETEDWVNPNNYPGDANGPAGARASTISRNLKTIS